MTTKKASAVEMPHLSPFPDSAAPEALRHSARAKLFCLVFVLTLFVGLAITFLQPTVYRATATVLMTAPVAIDAAPGDANVQDVAIQSRILLGGEVAAALLQAMRAQGESDIDISYLRERLQVQPVDATNLVEMSATGSDAERLSPLVNHWIDVYLQVRAGSIQANQRQTVQIVQDQLGDLDLKLTEARVALSNYRENHNIASAERQENAVMSRLDGLNEALNTALENEVTARAHLQTLEEAISRGQKVVPVSERDGVAAMEKELTELRLSMAELSQSYTMEYIRKQPLYRDIPERITQLENDLAALYNEGQAIELAAAGQRFNAAEQTVQALQQQYEQHREEASKFTTIYATHESLAEDLARLEAMNREAQARLIEVEVNQVNKYPQVSVIDRAPVDSLRIGPDYRLWLGGTLAASLGLGVLAVWLYGFLGPRQQPAYVTLSGVHMYPPDAASQLPPANTAALASDTGHLLSDEHDAAGDANTNPARD